MASQMIIVRRLSHRSTIAPASGQDDGRGEDDRLGEFKPARIAGRRRTDERDERHMVQLVSQLRDRLPRHQKGEARRAQNGSERRRSIGGRIGLGSSDGSMRCVGREGLSVWRHRQAGSSGAEKRTIGPGMPAPLQTTPRRLSV
jgi:hypothetical protein